MTYQFFQAFLIEHLCYTNADSDLATCHFLKCQV